MASTLTLDLTLTNPTGRGAGNDAADPWRTGEIFAISGQKGSFSLDFPINGLFYAEVRLTLKTAHVLLSKLFDYTKISRLYA
jgi:hypothetical protein